jgi:multicomponent Na+:H+ antiporter subunit D
VIAILLSSSMLNAAYFLPILHVAWFGGAASAKAVGDGGRPIRDARPMLVVPALVTALLSLLFGLLAGAAWSPLQWAHLIVLREFGL